MTRTIMVTGGCGWLGSAIVRNLLERGDKVVATDIVVSSELKSLAETNSGLSLEICDLAEWPQLMDLFRRYSIDAVIHAAALVGVLQVADIPLKALRANVECAVNLFEAMRQNEIRRVVHISTEETYGDFLSPVIDEEHPQKPVSIYGLTKLAAEHYGRVYSRNHGLECINVRTCWVYGPNLPRLRLPRTFIEAALRGEPFHQQDGASFAVDQVYIDDTVSGILLALDKQSHRFDAYNVATGVASSIADVAEAVNRAIPGARITVGDSGEKYRLDDAIVSADKGALDIGRARAELGYEPKYDLQNGIEATIAATRAVGGRA